MKIAIDAREIEGRPTGAGRVLSEVLNRWESPQENGHQVFLLFKRQMPDHPFLGRKGTNGCLIGLPGLRYDVFWEQTALPSFLKEADIDVFWSPNGACPVKRPTCQNIVQINDLTFFVKPSWFSFKEGLVRRWRASRSIRAADKICAISQATADDIKNFFPQAASKISILTPGADHCLERGSLRLPDPRSPKLLMVGSILNRRPADSLIKAVALLKDKYPGVTLDIVGENRTLPRQDLAGLVRECDLTSHVNLVGYAMEASLDSIYARADIFVFPSFYEGFGIPIVEAQRNGLAVVTLRNSSLAEVGGDSVCYAGDSSPRAWARAISGLVDDRAFFAQIRSKGYENARKFLWSKTRDGIFAMMGIKS